MADHIYDIETYPNFFSLIACDESGTSFWQYEISTRRNDIAPMLQFLWYLSRVGGARMVGFNNEGFDYPVIHHIMQVGEAVTVDSIYAKAQAIITRNDDDRFSHMVWEADRFIEQVDLFKIHHFDNRAKSTSLKAIQFAMRSESIEDLPYPPGTMLTPDQMDHTLVYNRHDVTETLAFYRHTLPAIRFREELSRRYGRNFINFNDTKIGKEYLIMELEKAAPGCCYDYSSGCREPRQTIRHSIRLGDIILPYIRFNRPEFQRVRDWLAAQTITETKGVFEDLTATVDGFSFSFGLGGIHGSIDSAIVLATDDYAIVDLDVTSFYPSLSIVNNFNPAHLGDVFGERYAGLKAERVQHKKGSAPNAMLKLALNGSFGDTNNAYSPFYDPQCMMSITINGQLLLCMLAERLMQIDGLRMIQANTDGVTVYCPRGRLDELKAVGDEWQHLTGMELEQADYSRMFIRDVNNYIAETTSRKIKRKGAYCHETPLQNPDTQELPWYKDHGGRVIAKAAEAALLDGEDIAQYIATHTAVQPLDFMLREKVSRGHQLMWGDESQQRITRYYISNIGRPMTKIMPPAKGKENLTFDVYQMPDGTEFYARLKADYTKAEKKGYIWLRKEVQNAKPRHQDVNKGWLATVANDLRGVSQFDFNLEWYIAEARKLVDPLKPFEV